MPRRSKVELSNDTQAKLEEEFYKLLDSLSTDETRRFFNEFLTNEEKMMMFKRLALYWALFEGRSLASIQKTLGVTHDTTRLYNKKKNQMSEDFKSLVRRVEGITEVVAQQEAQAEGPHEEAQQTGETNWQPEEAQAPTEQPVGETEAQTAPEPQQPETHAQEAQEQPAQETQQNQDQEGSEQSSEEEPKKKKGFGRFFGF